nr:hypothetical protein [Tanacetum cinerariifolium]
MSTQQDIYAAGSESRPPMLNKENYVPWSSRLLRYAKSRPNGKLIYNSILNGPYVRKMIPEPGDANRDITVTETFHLQTDNELSDKELKQIEADDQAIQTILLGLPKDIYAVEKKAKLFNELERFTSNEGNRLSLTIIPKWSRHVTIVHQTKDLHTADYTQLYDFLKYNQKEVIQNAVQNLRVQNVKNQNGLISVQGNGNQNQIGNGNLVAARAEGNAAGQNGNQIRCYNCRRVEEYDLMAAAADLDEIEEVNVNCILMANLQQALTSGTQTNSAPVSDTDGSAEVHENCDDNEIFNMFTQEEQYTKLLEPIPESHQVPQKDNDVISKDTSVEQGGETVEQHPANFEETRALYESLYQNLAIEVEKVNSVNHKLKETNADLSTELARFKNQERCFEISKEKYDKLKRCYQQSVYQEQCLSKKINAFHLSTVTPNEPVNSLIMGDKHLDTVPATELDEFIKSSVENLVPNPSESKGENGCDLLACFTTFSNILFDAEYEFDSVDNQPLHNEDFPKEIFSNPLFEEEISSIKKNQHHFNVESDLVESMLNHDSSIIPSSSKIDSLLDEFAGELTLLKSIPPGVDKTDCHPANEIRLSQRLLYDNSSPRPSEEFVSENSNADDESFSPSPIMEEIDLT